MFAALNAERYFELFQLARLMMPLFSIVGGLGRFRLVAAAVRDLGRALEPRALGVLPQHPGPRAAGHVRPGLDRNGRAATYVFWRYLQKPSWRWARRRGGRCWGSRS